MRKNFGAKAILYPMPVLIIGTYDENGKPNAMNAAWGSISEETQISICVDDGHKTAKNVVKTIFESPSPFIKIEFQGGDPSTDFEMVKYIIEEAEWQNLFKKRFF